MKSNDNGKSAATPKETTDSKQVHMIVDGCKIKLNFPVEPEQSAITDIKRMMLGGAVKT